MPIPTIISDLSTTANSNSPSGADSPADIDNYIRAHGAFIAQLRDGTGLTGLATTGGAAMVGFIQSGTGAVATTVQDELRQIVRVTQFGASPSASAAVNTAAIQAAADYCKANGYSLRGSPGVFSTNGTISLECSGDLSEMTISCPGATVPKAIQVGTTSGAATFRIDLKLPQVTNSSKVGAGWVGFDTSVGVDIGNLYQSTVTFRRIYGFGINLHIGGYNVGNSYNNYYPGHIIDGKVLLKVGPKSSTGWSNENNYYGGQYVRSTSEGVSPIIGAYDIWLYGTSAALSTTNVNNNVFYRPSVENANAEFNFNFEDASCNTIIAPRLEVTGGANIRFFSTAAGETNSNLFINGYKTNSPNYTFAGASSPYNKYLGSRLNDALDYTGCGISMSNQSGSDSNAPHIQGFESGQNAIDKKASSTNWKYRIHGNGLSLKNAASSFAESDMTPGVYRIGDGTVATDRLWRGAAGSPEGVYTANIGSKFSRFDGGVGTSLYIKESGTGNTGWVPVARTTPGSFTLSAAATTTVNNTNITATSRIMIMPTNAAAATLMSAATALYVSAKTVGTSFAVTTANAAAAAGTETFDYIIVN